MTLVKIRLSLLMLAFLCCAGRSTGQSFILDRIFQPSMSINTELTFDLNQNNDKLHIAKLNANLIIPVKSKLDLEIEWKKIFNVRSWKDVKNMASIKAYQIFWTLKPQLTGVQYVPTGNKISPFSNPYSVAFGVQTGITGIHLMKKFRLLLYSANISIQEDIHSYNKLRPNGTALLGVVHFKGFRYLWYYGLALSVNDGQNLPVFPVPFLGAYLKLGNKIWWNITLPLQTRIEFKPNSNLRVDLLASLGNYGFGFGSNVLNRDYSRHYISGLQLKTGLAFHFKTKGGTKFFLEAGYLPFRAFQFDAGKTSRPFANPELGPTPYFAFSVFYGLKKSLIGSSLASFLNF
jgi:hypothetical protein